MLILGIETSCDETSAAVVKNGNEVLSNIVSSQVEIHSRYGGIVPEVASRQHVLEIVPIVKKALKDANVSIGEINALAVTNGPGLAGPLMVGVNFAKSLSYSLKIPIIPVNHLEGHTYAAWLEYDDPAIDPGFPLVVLIASGAHTHLVLMSDHLQYRVLGQTLDDAVGEAFDKAARILGLGYPGGPAIEKIAKESTATESMPRAWLPGTLDFSFSGVKTALLNRAKALGLYSDQSESRDASLIPTLASAFQEAVVDVISEKATRACEINGARGLILGGGVSANGRLREECRSKSEVPVLVPAPKLCTDNGAMIAAAAFYRFNQGPNELTLDFDAHPSLVMA